MRFGPVDPAVAVQSIPPDQVLFGWSEIPGENAQRPTYEPHGLASDEPFAIPAHRHGAGLRQNSKALEVTGRRIVRAGSNHEHPNQ